MSNVDMFANISKEENIFPLTIAKIAQEQKKTGWKKSILARKYLMVEEDSKNG